MLAFEKKFRKIWVPSTFTQLTVIDFIVRVGVLVGATPDFEERGVLLTEKAKTIAWEREGTNIELDRPVRFHDGVCSNNQSPTRFICTVHN